MPLKYAAGMRWLLPLREPFMDFVSVSGGAVTFGCEEGSVFRRIRCDGDSGSGFTVWSVYI